MGVTYYLFPAKNRVEEALDRGSTRSTRMKIADANPARLLPLATPICMRKIWPTAPRPSRQSMRDYPVPALAHACLRA